MIPPYVNFMVRWLTAIVAIFTFSLVVWAEEVPVDGLELFLTQQSRIRILAVNAPGHGHQMTTVAWVHRLRELGFVGQIEVVVEPGALPKVQELMPELQWTRSLSTGVRFFFPEKNLSFVGLTELKNDLAHGHAERVEFAIVPAEDWYHGQSIIRQIAPGRPTPKESLGAQSVLRMQPMSWRDGLRSFEMSDLQPLSFEDLRDLPLSLPTLPKPLDLTPKEVKKWLALIQPISDYDSRTQLTQILLDDRFLSFPFYCGHHESVVYLSRLSLAASRMGLRKPIRIWVASKLTDFQWQNLKASLLRQIRHETIRLIDLSKASTDLIGASREPNLELVRLVSLPPALMYFLAEHASLPPAVTGKFSQSIMFQLGKPFVELKYFDDLQETLKLSAETLTAAQALSRELNQRIETAEPIDVRDSLRNFWNMANKEDFMNSYAALKSNLRTNDLVRASLNRCAQLLLQGSRTSGDAKAHESGFRKGKVPK